MNIRQSIGATLVAVVLLAAVLVVVIAPGRAHAANAAATPTAPTPPPATTSATFHDSTNHVVLSFSFEATQKSAGDYLLIINGVGNISGTVPLLRTSPTTGLIDADSVPAKFTAPGASKPQATTMTMDGAVDVGHSAAGLVFTVLGQLYSLVDYLPSTSTAPARVLAIGVVIQNKNWNALYSMLSAEQQKAISRAQFVASFTSQTGPSISQIQLAGTGASEKLSGALYWHQPITITATPSGGVSQQYSSTMDLVAEGGQWRFLDNTDPVHS